MKIMSMPQVLLLTLLAAVLLAGCGGSSGGGSPDRSSGREVILTQGEETEVQPGDEVTAEEEGTRIEVRHLLEDNRKTVTLLAGSAHLLRAE